MLFENPSNWIDWTINRKYLDAAAKESTTMYIIINKQLITCVTF